MSINPALTPDEWADKIARGWGYRGIVEMVEAGEFHAAVALMCHGQPFGFTREMIRALADLLDLAEDAGAYIRDPSHPDSDAPRMALARQAVANLEALLPPDDADPAPNLLDEPTSAAVSSEP